MVLFEYLLVLCGGVLLDCFEVRVVGLVYGMDKILVRLL